MATVYCLVCNITGEKYYGSTKRTLYQRLAGHKCDLDCSSKQIILRGDYDIYKLIHCETKDEAELKEGWYIRNKECVNKQRVKVTDEERKEGDKKRNEEYYENNSKKIKENSKEYYENNRKKIKEWKKEWYEKNKEKLKEKVECEFCGIIGFKRHLKRHQKSQSCLIYQKKLK